MSAEQAAQSIKTNYSVGAVYPVQFEPPEGPLHDDYKTAFSLWKQIRDVMKGEKAVKDRGRMFLPQMSGQTDQEYLAYISRATFFNALYRTKQGLMGSIFGRQPVVSYPEGEKAYLKVIGRANETLLTLLRKASDEVLTTARAGLLVDRPEGAGEPYIAVYKAEEILNWRQREIKGRKVVDQVLLLEHYETPGEDDIGVDQKPRWRVLELDSEGYYRQRVTEAVKKNGSPDFSKSREIVPTNRGALLDFIPFIFVGPWELGPQIQKPPLEDIFWLNLSHYRSYADLEHGRHYTALPTYYVAGDSDDENGSQLAVGPNVVWELNAGDQAGILEYRGAGLSYLENALESKQSQMATLGAKLLAQQRKQAALGETMLRMMERGETSILMSITDNLNEAFTQALRWVFWWKDYRDVSNVSVEVNQDFTDGPMTARELRVIQTFHEEGLLPISTMYSIFRRLGIIPSDVTIEEYRELLNTEDEFVQKDDVDAGTSPSNTSE